LSWSSLPISEQQVRDYLDLEGTTGKYRNELIASNIRAAASFIERETGRQFEPQTNTTKYFTTEGRAALRIPDLRTATSITLQGAALTADESYWLIRDSQGSFTTVQFRAFGTGHGSRSYLSNPEWFDRNLDRDWNRYGYSSLPNDLVITGNWGYDPPPWDFLHAVKVLAAWYTKRPASVLANVALTPEGTELRYSDLPPEVSGFINSWKLGTVAVAI
jgi:hypothetical protein